MPFTGYRLHTLLQCGSCPWAAALKNCCRVCTSHGEQPSRNRLLQDDSSVGQLLLHGLHSMLQRHFQEPILPWAIHELQLPVRYTHLLCCGVLQWLQYGCVVRQPWLEARCSAISCIPPFLRRTGGEKKMEKTTWCVKIKLVLCKGKAMVPSSSFPLAFAVEQTPSGISLWTVWATLLV